jgi:hypothetical protein
VYAVQHRGGAGLGAQELQHRNPPLLQQILVEPRAIPSSLHLRAA